MNLSFILNNFTRTSLYVSRYITNQTRRHQWAIVCTTTMGIPYMMCWNEDEIELVRQEISPNITVGTLSKDRKPHQFYKIPLNRDNMPYDFTWTLACWSPYPRMFPEGLEHPESALGSEHYVRYFLEELERMGHLPIGGSAHYMDTIKHGTDTYDALSDGERGSYDEIVYLD